MYSFYIQIGRDSLDGMATRYGLGGPGFESRWRPDFSHPSRPALGPNQHPMQLVTGLPRGVKRPGRGVDHPPPPSAEVKERIELHLYAASGPSWPVIGWTLLYLYPLHASRYSLSDFAYKTLCIIIILPNLLNPQSFSLYVSLRSFQRN
jgi:hypothetical protein